MNTPREAQQQANKLTAEIASLYERIRQLTFDRNVLIESFRVCKFCFRPKWTCMFHENAGNRCAECKRQQDRERYAGRKAA